MKMQHVEVPEYILYLQSQDFDVYINYASNYREAVNVLERLLENAGAVEYLKVMMIHILLNPSWYLTLLSV